MTRPSIRRLPIIIISALVLATVLPVRNADAHCDGIDGPVASAGKRALETGNLDLARIWIKADSEPELAAAFTRSLEVRKLGGAAQELAERWFLETLVRLHRAGEGEPYTGLQPAGRDLGPAIPAADRAIATGSPKQLEKLLLHAVKHGLEQRFARISATRRYAAADVAAGRAFVEAYVGLLHFAEHVHATAGAHAGH